VPEGRSHRLFVALEPTDLVRRRIGAIAAQLRRSAGRAAEEVRWVAPENVHLTLQFLGAVPEPSVEAVAEAVRAAAATSRPLALEVQGAGGCPNARRPRVVWAGIAGDVPALAALVQDLGRRLAPLGFAPETRPYSPTSPSAAPAPAAARPVSAGRSQKRRRATASRGARTSSCCSSRTSPKGPRYEALVRAPLGRAPETGPASWSAARALAARAPGPAQDVPARTPRARAPGRRRRGLRAGPERGHRLPLRPRAAQGSAPRQSAPIAPAARSPPRRAAAADPARR
jgi:2'-5' RNA ligase